MDTHTHTRAHTRARARAHTHTHFRELQEHNMEIIRFVDDKECYKKKRKNIAIKATKCKDTQLKYEIYQSNIDKYMKLMFQNFKKFLMHNEKISIFEEINEEIFSFIPTCNQNQKINQNQRRFKKLQEKVKRAYISWDENYDKEKSNICIMTNHEEDKVTSYFSYQDLFHICINLTRKTSKLEQIVSSSKNTIFSLRLKNKNLLEEINRLKER